MSSKGDDARARKVEKLIKKMMKFGIPFQGAIKLVTLLNDDQITGALVSDPFLSDVIDELYYNQIRTPE